MLFRSKKHSLTNEYNVFVLRDQTQSHTNFEGKVAVAGSINYAYNNVATTFPISTTSFDLIVGSEIYSVGGSVQNNTAISTNGIISYYDTENNNGVVNPIYADIIDFNAVTEYLLNAASIWSSKEPTGTAVISGKKLTLT